MANNLPSKRRFCEGCCSFMAKTQYYDHLPCNNSASKKGKSFYCGHCKQVVSKSTYYEHKILYGNNAEFEDPLHLDLNNTSLAMETSEQEYSDNGIISDEEIELEEEDLNFFSDEGSSSDEESNLSGLDAEENAVNEEIEPNISHCQANELPDGIIPENEDESNSVNGDGHHTSSESRSLLMFLLLWQSLYKVSDKGILLLLKFLKGMLQYIAELCEYEALKEFAKCIPETMYMVYKTLWFEKDDFEKYAVCSECKSLYLLKDCVIKNPNGDIASLKCNYVRYPRHPHRTRRQPCGTTLLKTKRSSNGSVYLYPKQMYCYKKVIESIQDLLHKKNFINDCEKWRDRNLPDSTLGDVYEGQVWKDFQTANGEPFLSAPNNFGLMLNVDWFQPTKHGIHSIGVIYMVVMNLPRDQRFKMENAIVVGIIPGPKEPKLHLNTFLQPLIDELVDLWDGVLLDSGNGIYEKYRAALLALSCDIPAIRKCGGFLGHGANRGCNKCYKEFPRKFFGDKPDFSGFNRDDWEKRTHEQCKRHAEHYQQANFCTATKAKACASKTGIRYSVLYELPYYDAVRFTLIDPMHNLLLGTAKHVLNTWVKEGYLSNKDLTRLQTRVNKVKAPSNIGRLPSKIANGFAGFTADQWKNWICIYSLFALRGIIPNDHYVMWSDFVHACQALCSKVLTLQDISNADEKLNQFCCKFEELLGKDSCTPNMHLHGHLKQCIVDYGPIYSFWCFSFERYNGILGEYQTNNTNIGLQIMRKFYRDKEVMMSQFPKEMAHVTQIIESATNPKGTLLEMTLPSKQYLEMLSLQMSSPLEVNFAKTPDQVPLLPIKRKALEQREKRKLEEMYALIYDTSNIKHVSQFCQSFTRLLYAGNLYSSSTTKDDNASVITATWCDEMKRPAVVRGFLLHDVILKVENNSQQKVTHVLAKVDWYTTYSGANIYSHPVKTWSTVYEPYSKFSFMPVGRFQQKCVVVRGTVKASGNRNDQVNIVIPLPLETRI